MTAREAFTFFRGQRKVQAKLKYLLDVGLDYLRLGQPATTLSGGEAQRLKLAGNLAAKRHGRTLFVLDEPTTGLHFSDIVQLVDCFDALLEVGHSLIVVEHNLQLMKAADWIIDLGPGAADEGGRVVVAGTPEEVAACAGSVTGRVLAREFARDAALVDVEEEKDLTPRRKAQRRNEMGFHCTFALLRENRAMISEIEIVVGEVSDVEACVYARYHGPVGGVILRGTLRGPFCETSRTLPAEFAFRDLGKDDVAESVAVVPDPCMWSPEMPHLYRVDLEALQGEHVIAEHQSQIGLRRLAPRLPVDFAPGTG